MVTSQDCICSVSYNTLNKTLATCLVAPCFLGDSKIRKLPTGSVDAQQTKTLIVSSLYCVNIVSFLYTSTGYMDCLILIETENQYNPGNEPTRVIFQTSTGIGSPYSGRVTKICTRCPSAILVVPSARIHQPMPAGCFDT